MKQFNKSTLRFFAAFFFLMPFWVFAVNTHNEYVYKFTTPSGGEETVTMQMRDIDSNTDQARRVGIIVWPGDGSDRTGVSRAYGLADYRDRRLADYDNLSCLSMAEKFFDPQLWNFRVFSRLNQWANYLLPLPLSNRLFSYLDHLANYLGWSLLYPSDPDYHMSFGIPTFINPANLRELWHTNESTWASRYRNRSFGTLSNARVTGVRERTPTEVTYSVVAPHFSGIITFGSITLNRRAEVTHANFGRYGSVTLISSSYDVPDNEPDLSYYNFNSFYGPVYDGYYSSEVPSSDEQTSEVPSSDEQTSDEPSSEGYYYDECCSAGNLRAEEPGGLQEPSSSSEPLCTNVCRCRHCRNRHFRQ